MCIERFLESVKRLLAKYEQLTIHDDFFCTPAGRIKNEAGPVNAENFSGRINEVSSLRIGPHVYRNRLGACRRDSFHIGNSSCL